MGLTHWKGEETMKSIKLTDEELRTIVWALANYSAHVKLENSRNGRPMNDNTTRKLCEISSKFYAKLVGAKEENE